MKRLFIILTIIELILGGLIYNVIYGSPQKIVHAEDQDVTVDTNKNKSINEPDDIKTIKIEKNTDELLEDLNEILNNTGGTYSVMATNLNTGESISINSEAVLAPASIFKVPFAMLVLKDIENGKFSLETELTLKPGYKMYTTDNMYYAPSNSKYTIRYLLETMLSDSDNTAMNVIYQSLYLTRDIDRRFKEELGLANTSHVPFQTTTADVTRIFRLLYDHSYLNESNSEYVLSILSNVPEYFNDRIAAGVPENTKVAHKIGNLAGVYQDAGIVYTDSGDYIIVVLNDGVDSKKAANTIKEISSKVWEYFHI